MKTFNQFVEEVSYTPTVHQMTKKLIENGIDPVKYAYLRLAELATPQQAAAQAPAMPVGNNPTAEIGQLTAAVNGILQKYGKTMPNVGKVATNMSKEVQTLTAAAQQDAQATQQIPAPAQPAGMPNQQQAMPGQLPKPVQPQQRPAQPQPMQPIAK